jgi:hypothetical protein
MLRASTIPPAPISALEITRAVRDIPVQGEMGPETRRLRLRGLQ